MSNEEFEMAFDQNFTTILSNGDTYKLKYNGDNILVKSSTFNEFKDLVLKARNGECLA